jgi:DNA mismatch repair protein MutH
MQHISPPQSLAQLCARADKLAHMNLGQLADFLCTSLPENLLHHKGFIGQCLEAALGADAGSDNLPDFTQLGVELKTLPVGPSLRPQESTYISTVPLHQLQGLTWENSAVKAKLNHVLWVPLLILPNTPLSERKILPPFLWQPSPEQESILKTDFDELIDLIALGDISQITASLGTYLHIRPKAAHARSLTSHADEVGAPSQTLPRGFYLRAGFTATLLDDFKPLDFSPFFI